MKTFDLINSKEWLQKILKMDLDVTKAYALRKFILETESTIKLFYETREDLIKKYWIESEWQIVVKKENTKKYFADLDKILDIEIQIEIPEITINDLSGKIDTDTLLQLQYLIK